MNKIDFDHRAWLRKFRAASAARSGFRELRMEIFEDTVAVVTSGGYQIDGLEISVNSDAVAEETEYFTAPSKLPESLRCQTTFSVIEADCLETAGLLLNFGFKVCVLNMASRQNPGGGVTSGAGAQEENIFRRTNLFKSLYQFTDYASEYGIKRSEYSYPLDRNSGGVYSGGITVFRASENNGYALLKNPYRLSFVSVPAINRPELEKRNNQYHIARPLIEPVKEKIRTILRISGKYGHDTLVLSAFGCGAFANPPYHVALLFREVFNEPEFENRFRAVVFSIIDDHNSHKEHNPDGNVLPFLEVFGEMKQ